MVLILLRMCLLFAGDGHAQLSTLCDPTEIVAELQAAAKGAPVQPIPASIRVLANQLVVFIVPDQQIFTVSTPDGTANAVRLFPHQSCTCPASSTCCHILAAKRSIGLDCNERKLINLTNLRRNSR